MEDQKEQTPCVQASAPRLVDFWESNPHGWLAYAESHFRRAGIKNELTKFDVVVEKLPMTIINKLTDLITYPPEHEPYAKLRSEIIKIVSLTDRERYQALMQQLEIGDSKPSELYQRMKQLLSNENIDAFFFRQMFLQKLPPIIRQMIAFSCPPDTPLDQLVDKADKAYEINYNTSAINSFASPQSLPTSNSPLPNYEWMANQILDLKKELAKIRLEHKRSRSRDKSRSRSRRHSTSTHNRYKKATEDTCFYHINFGTAARNCRPPCKYSGNQTARH